MDENKKHTDEDRQQSENRTTDKGDERYSVKESLGNERDDENSEAAINPGKPDTGIVQDLLESVGLGFWRANKRVDPDPDEVKEANKAPDLVKDLTKPDNENHEGSPAQNLGELWMISQDQDVGKLTEVLNGEHPVNSETGKLPERKKFNRKLLIAPALILMSYFGYQLYGYVMEPKPPSADVVATFSGKNLTKEELSSYINSKGYKDAENHPLHSLESFKQVIKIIAVQRIVEDWAKEKGITQKNEVKHDFKHIVEEVSLDKLVDKVHKDQLSPDKVDKLEIQKYYDANRDKYKDKPFAEVEGEIRNILAAEMDKDFFSDYIEKLKKNAALNVNYDILKVEVPTETEMKSFYEQNRDKYSEPKKVKMLEIKVDVVGLEDEARKKAEEALAKIRSGERFEDVAKRYSTGKQFDAYYVKQGEKGIDFEDKVFSLQVNELSSAFKDGNSFYIAKVVEKLDKRQKTFGEALNEVKTEVMKEKEDKQYELKKNEALFSVHGKRFTLGEFKEEFKELTPETQAKFAGVEAKKSLIDQLIAKELLLEESGDDVADKENSKEVEELKSQYIQQILHKEEIDEKLGEITDEEAQKYYEENKGSMVEPPKAKISLIRVDQGTSDAEKKRARQRIDEALQKIQAGMEFSAIAKEYSNDPTASAGGEVKPWIYDDDHLGPVFKKNISKLQINEISNVFEYESGYFIVKLQQKEDKKQKIFDEVKEQLKQALQDEQHRKKEAALEDELLTKSQLVIYNSSIKQVLKEETETKK
jgi:parvulin-like peptidyl-prolyl isomerase